VRGEIRVHLHNAASEVLLQVREVDLEGRGPFVVEAARRERDAVLLRLRGSGTREAADALRGLAVRVPREALPPPDEDEYYFCDLVGLRVVKASGEEVGVVEDVVDGPGHATLVVGLKGTRVEVPLAERFVVGVEIAAGRIIVQGLEDLAVD